MASISILANTVRPSVDHTSDDTASAAGTFSWQDPVHFWKAGPGEVMTVEKQQQLLQGGFSIVQHGLICPDAKKDKDIHLNRLEHSVCFQVKPDSTDGYEIDGGSRLENISDLFDRILAPYKVKRKIDSTIR